MSTVVVLGASPKEERYSNQAVQMLLDYKHHVIPVHLREKSILGCPCVSSLSEISEPVDTLTVYLGEKNSAKLLKQILALNPRRVILNPGAESTMLQEEAENANIEVVLGCTLVMLRTEQF